MFAYVNGSAAPVAVASVPQKRTPPVVDFTSQLAALRFKTASDVVVAFVVVALIAVRLVMVDDAYAVSPPLNWVRVEVALPARANG